MKLLIILILLLPVIVYSQDTIRFGPKERNLRASEKYVYNQPKLKEYLPSLLFYFASGGFQGSGDASRYYHIKNGGFFDGRTSWQRKYKNGDYKQGAAFPLSTSVLAPFTDNVHFSPMMSNECEAWGAVMMPNDNNRRFGHLLLKVAAITLVRSAGHVLMYDLIIPNQNR